jgi:hypothetical protein
MLTVCLYRNRILSEGGWLHQNLVQQFWKQQPGKSSHRQKSMWNMCRYYAG